MEWFIGSMIISAVGIPVTFLTIYVEGYFENEERERKQARIKKQRKALPTVRTSQNRTNGAA